MRSARIFIVFSLGFILGGVVLYGLFASESLNIFTGENGIFKTDSQKEKDDSEHDGSYYDSTINQAQDTKLMADLKSIQTALEQYYVENGSYPKSLSLLTQEGFINEIPINMVILTYERPDPDSYTLSTKLSSGEDYTLSSD